MPIVEAERSSRRLTQPKSELKTVDALLSIGNTYRYRDFIVVPSQYYAKWAGAETRIINQAIDRLEERNRLEKNEHFFRITNEEAKDFINITGCDLSFQEVLKGLVLLTLRAVNTLSHYFNDPNSIARSNQIDDAFTSMEQITKSNLTGIQQMYAMSNLIRRWIDMEEQQVIIGAQLETMGKNIALTDAKVDATKLELEQHRQSSRLNRDQIDALEDMFRIKNKEHGHPSVQGLVQRHLKQVFLGHRASGNSYKDIAAKHFPEMLERAKAWIPTPAERDIIKTRRLKDGLEN